MQEFSVQRTNQELLETLDKADSAYQKPVSGIPESDFTQEVRDKLDSSGGEIIPHTYAELSALVNDEKLVTSALYQLTDYRTRYSVRMLNETTGAVMHVAQERVLPIGRSEQLILKATTASTFEPIALSLDFPQDIIYYNFNDTDIVSSDGVLVETGARTGFITRRVDTIRDIDVQLDWRTITFLRYRPDAPPFVEGQSVNAWDYRRHNDVIYRAIRSGEHTEITNTNDFRRICNANEYIMTTQSNQLSVDRSSVAFRYIIDGGSDITSQNATFSDTARRITIKGDDSNVHNNVIMVDGTVEWNQNAAIVIDRASDITSVGTTILNVELCGNILVKNGMYSRLQQCGSVALFESGAADLKDCGGILLVNSGNMIATRSSGVAFDSSANVIMASSFMLYSSQNNVAENAYVILRDSSNNEIRKAYADIGICEKNKIFESYVEMGQCDRNDIRNSYVASVGGCNNHTIKNSSYQNCGGNRDIYVFNSVVENSGGLSRCKIIGSFLQNSGGINDCVIEDSGNVVISGCNYCIVKNSLDITIRESSHNCVITNDSCDIRIDGGCSNNKISNSRNLTIQGGSTNGYYDDVRGLGGVASLIISGTGTAAKQCRGIFVTSCVNNKIERCENVTLDNAVSGCNFNRCSNSVFEHGKHNCNFENIFERTIGNNATWLNIGNHTADVFRDAGGSVRSTWYDANGVLTMATIPV